MNSTKVFSAFPGSLIGHSHITAIDEPLYTESPSSLFSWSMGFDLWDLIRSSVKRRRQ